MGTLTPRWMAGATFVDGIDAGTTTWSKKIYEDMASQDPKEDRRKFTSLETII